MKKIYKTIDLFAGIGGIRKGFEDAGFETVFANDFDKYCKITYDLNFNNPKLNCEDVWDLTKKELPKFDFLLAGFPCQAFSIAGYRRGFNDVKGRGNLFFAIKQILEKYQPIGFLLENVKNLKSHDKGKTFKVIMSNLSSIGYYMPEPAVLNSMDYGNVPQTRERIYIVGFKNKKYAERFRFPEKIKLTTQLKDILDKNVDDKFYYNGKPLYEKIKDHIGSNSVYQWRRIYVRENKKGVVPTLTANMGMGGHNVPIIKDEKGIRKLTPRECARAQGYPDNFVLPDSINMSQLYKQIGNSVSVSVLKRIAEQIKIAID
ncbi:MAG: DNA (cytosine-5-)-methyltransferase [Actinobacteria bacterium]|nr:DNA (cytosine-5-)-methyltransferase [Actinomycetota bacterium]